MCDDVTGDQECGQGNGQLYMHLHKRGMKGQETPPSMHTYNSFRAHWLLLPIIFTCMYIDVHVYMYLLVSTRTCTCKNIRV